ncbi:MAG: hypothetical protein GY757_12820 [bacterium]|nr:hypothetical protein [bacterium]
MKIMTLRIKGARHKNSFSTPGNDIVSRGSKETITIECDKRLFRALNQFDPPLKKKLVIRMKEVSGIEFKKFGVLIKPETSLYKRYRNLFHEIRYISFFAREDKKALIFLLDDFESITKEDHG